MKCKKCDLPYPDSELLEGFCQECIFTMAGTGRQVTHEQIHKVKELVEAETAGLFPGGLLMDVLDDLADRLTDGEDREDCIIRASNEIQRMGGLGICREMRKMAETMEQLSQQMYEEIQKKVRVLSNLKR